MVHPPEMVSQIQLLIRSRHPIVTVETVEEARGVERIAEAARELELRVFEWSMTTGLCRTFPKTGGRVPGSEKLEQALDFLQKGEPGAVYIFKDLCGHLENPLIERLLREGAAHCGKTGSTLFLIDPRTVLPPSLKRMSIPLEWSLPDETELAETVRETYHSLSKVQPVSSRISKEDFPKLVANLRGLTREEASRAVSRAVLEDGKLTGDDVEQIIRIKHDMIRDHGALEFVSSNLDLSDVGGLEQLKGWLKKRSGALSAKAKEFGLEPPRGILLLGVQGCGKSLMAKVVAASWKLPLFRLDPASLYTKFIGESEQNLRKALKAAGAMSPVVLWIDEIEKGFASSGSDADGGVSRRLLGTFLTWMQDRKAAVFLVATANDVTALPPELLRKGRFDEIFFVDLPDAAARRTIFRIHLEKRKRDPKSFDLDRLAETADGFSGAEIEQAVISALYSAFSESKELDTETILAELSITRPLSVTMAEKIAALRLWADGRCVPA